MLAGASARARTVREHDQACMSLHLRGRSRRELLSALPCTAHMHDFSPACWMKFHSPRVISREFGRQHPHMMHESCCTYREQHDGVLEAVMTGCFRASFGEIPRFCLWSSNNFCVIHVISREFGREHQHMMHESCCTYREQHDGVLEAVMTGFFRASFGEIPCAGDNFCLVRVISREFGTVLGWP